MDYTTTASSAVAGVDFVGTSGTLVFPSGVSTQSFTVPLIDDSVCETTPQTFSVGLANVVGGASIGSTSSTTVTIAASDGSGVFVGGEWALAITKPTSPVWTAFGLSLGTAVADFSRR